jgi:hypothetical protein
MAMPPYPIYCSGKGCKNQAEYKIAARWSDGVVSELKTYALCCRASASSAAPAINVWSASKTWNESC